MGRIDDIIQGTSGLRVGASADAAGAVLETSGDHDFETLCATLAMARPQLEAAADMLGLGNLQVVSFLHGEQTTYARFDDGRVDAFVGAATKSPDTVAQKLTSAPR
ncbi:MAG: hypothetical protein R2939_16480 [Kofleriaceae bacterium]